MATLTDMMSKFVSANTASSFGSGTLPGNTITNPKEELKGITTRSGVAYQGPKTPSLCKQGTKVRKDQVQTPSSQNTAPVQPSVIQSNSQAPVSVPVVAPVSAPMPNLKPFIPYPSRRDNEKRRDQANEQIEKFYEIFKEMSFEISFTDALILMPKFASTLKALVGNKEKLSEMARTTMNEHCSAVILNKLPRKLGDPGKFLIPCEFPRMDECLALVDLSASINLMPLSVWEGLSLPELTPTCMTLELTNRSVSKPISIAKVVSFKVGVFHFPADLWSLTLNQILENEAITCNLDQTVRYSANYNQMTANKIDVIESACEEYSQEVLGFSNVTASGTPVPHNDPIVSATSPGASINLMPFFVWEALLLPELTPTCMTLELTDRSVSKPIGIAKDVSFKTSRALIDVHKGELTLHIRKEAITYNLDQTVRYSANYDQMTANKIDVICEIYSQEVLGFFDVTTSGSPTPDDDLIILTTSPTLTPFGDSDFLLFEEADAFLSLENDLDSPKINPFYYDPEGDILLLEAILNSEPSPPLPNHEQYLPSYKKELKVCEAKTVKSSVDEPPEVELKDLPPHLKYAFLEGDNKLPIIIAKELGDEKKSALIKVLKSHKRAIA
uniref:Reverse transcriptase domain-containing protein n=1 Tax=Tanacetum cinerariifolium TaxID=118510 RepID=A0A699JWU3_TANCI|nr:reverse transcriptase domain-containing protein [Tanacetum cinerariifolium]